MHAGPAHNRGMKMTIIAASVTAVLWAMSQPVQGAPSPAPAKKRTKWVDPPIGSLLGRGAVDAGETGVSGRESGARLAGDDPALRNAVVKLDNEGATMVEGWTLIANAVAWQTKVPVKTLKQQQSTTGLSYGELLIANSLAAGSNNTFESVLAMKQKTKRWADLAKQLKINPDSITARAHAARESLLFAHSRRNQRRDENLRDSGFHNGQPNSVPALSRTQGGG